MQTLRNGIPLNVRHYGYTTLNLVPPYRVGDEARILDPYTGEHHVILLRGLGRRKYLVDVKQLRRYTRAQAKAQIAVLPSSK